MTQANAVDLLRRVNSKLHGVLEALNPEKHSCLNLEAEDLSSVLTDLLRAAECLRAMSNDASPIPPELVGERAQYHLNLLELERMLPDFQTRLLAEKSRLLRAQDHLDRAASWAGSDGVHSG